MLLISSMMTTVLPDTGAAPPPNAPTLLIHPPAPIQEAGRSNRNL